VDEETPNFRSWFAAGRPVLANKPLATADSEGQVR